MLEQQGQVIAARDGLATVRLGGRSGCAACDAGQGCGAGLFGKLLRRRPMLLEFENHLGARSGQGVVVGVPERWFLRLVARFYLLPLLAGLGGGALGHYLSFRLQSGPALRDLLSLAGAVLAAVVAFRWGHSRSAELSGTSEVHLLRVVTSSAAEKA